MLIDRLGTRIGFSLCMAFWTTTGLVHAFAVTPLRFEICHFMLGIGEAGSWPAAIKLTTEWFPPHERSTESGIFNSGFPLGAVIVPPLIVYLVDVHHLELKQIGWLAVIPFLIADVGNPAGGYFTQYIIARGLPIPRARKIAVTVAGIIISAPFLPVLL